MGLSTFPTDSTVWMNFRSIKSERLAYCYTKKSEEIGRSSLPPWQKKKRKKKIKEASVSAGAFLFG